MLLSITAALFPSSLSSSVSHLLACLVTQVFPGRAGIGSLSCSAITGEQEDPAHAHDATLKYIQFPIRSYDSRSVKLHSLALGCILFASKTRDTSTRGLPIHYPFPQVTTEFQCPIIHCLCETFILLFSWVFARPGAQSSQASYIDNELLYTMSRFPLR